MSPSISYSGRCTSCESATSSARGSQPTRSWIALSAGISDGPGNFPARASTPATRARGSAIGALDLNGAELELGNLPEGVDLIDRQQVRRRLSEVEGDEDVAARRRAGDARLAVDRAAPGGAARQLPVRDAELGGVGGVNVHQGLRRDRVQ